MTKYPLLANYIGLIIELYNNIIMRHPTGCVVQVTFGNSGFPQQVYYFIALECPTLRLSVAFVCLGLGWISGGALHFIPLQVKLRITPKNGYRGLAVPHTYGFLIMWPTFEKSLDAPGLAH